AVGQLQVEHDHVGVVLAHLLQPFGRGPRGQHLDALPLEGAAERVADVVFVIDDQQAGDGTPPPFGGNSKSEARNPKRIRSTNSKTGKKRTDRFGSLLLRTSDLFRISCFGFRISPQRAWQCDRETSPPRWAVGGVEGAAVLLDDPPRDAQPQPRPRRLA